MTCLHPDRIHLYLEGDLVPSERRDVEKHLRDCPACREAFEDRRALDRAFRSLPAVELPPGFTQSIMARIPIAEDSAFAWLVVTVSGTASFLAGLMGYHLLTGQSLPDILVSLGRSLGAWFGRLVPFFAKAFKAAALVGRLVADLATAFVKGLGILAALVGPEVLGIAIVLGAVLTFLFVLGAKRFLSLGEKT